MNVLGLSIFGQNPAACLFKDGKLVAFAEEERFVRIKSANGYFPKRAIQYCLSEGKIRLKDVKTVSVGWDSNKYSVYMPIFFGKQWLKYGIRFPGNTLDTVIKELALWRPENAKKRIHFELKSIGDYKDIKIEFIPHHMAHAASAFYASGFSRATIVILDGSGEEKATTVYKGEGMSIKEISGLTIPNSLGWFYAATTAYLGFKPYENDGFVMGLAPYGNKDGKIEDKINKIIKISPDGNYKIAPQYNLLGKHNINEHFSDQYIRLLGPPRLPGQPITNRHKNIAYEVQNALEKAIYNLVKRAIGKTGCTNLCLAGGVALNCKVNGVLAQSGFIDKMFIQPAAHDAGTALGAAMITFTERGEDIRFKMTHARWGPSFSETEIKQVLDETGVKYSKERNIDEKISEYLYQGKIVARFAGRMEAGPRALGGRSILANPTLKNMKNKINHKVKHREDWRPFCPSLTYESVNKYLEKPKETKFMNVIYNVPKIIQSKITGVVHIDGTTRPQTVDKIIDPGYYKIINKFGQKSGHNIVLNTSLNVKGEPMVCSPNDALRCFFSCGLDFLTLENFLVKK